MNKIIGELISSTKIVRRERERQRHRDRETETNRYREKQRQTERINQMIGELYILH